MFTGEPGSFAYTLNTSLKVAPPSTQEICLAGGFGGQNDLAFSGQEPGSQMSAH